MDDNHFNYITKMMNEKKNPLHWPQCEVCVLMVLWFKCERINQSAIYKNKNKNKLIHTKAARNLDLAQNKGEKNSPVTSPAFDLGGHNIGVSG